MPHGHRAEREPARPGHRVTCRATRWDTRFLHAIPDAAARRLRRARGRGQHAGCDPLTFEDDVFSAKLSERVTHRQSGLTTTNDDGVDLLACHCRSPLSDLDAKLSRCGAD